MVLTTLTLSGCSEVTSVKGADDETTSSTIESSVTSTVTTTKSEVSTSSSKPVTSTTSSEKSSVTSTATSTTASTSSTKIETSVPTTTSKVVENTPSTTTSTKTETPTEKTVDTHTHNFTEVTCTSDSVCTICGEVGEKAYPHPLQLDSCHGVATCILCGATQSIPVEHHFINGKCVCGETNSDYVAPSTEGSKYHPSSESNVKPNTNSSNNNSTATPHTHTWGESYTEVETRTEEVIEYHAVTGSGYDETLALRYFGKVSAPTDYGIVGTCTSSRDMKTTNTINTTKYFHKCVDCGYTEMYDSSEEVIPSNVWERCSNANRGEFSTDTIWWDVNNIPADVVAASDREKAAIEDWFQTW